VEEKINLVNICCNTE